MSLFSGFTLRDWLLFCGNGAMLACSVFYIAWWTVANRTGVYRPDSPALLGATLGAGLVSVVLFVLGTRVPLSASPLVPVYAVCIFCAVLYVLLLGVSSACFHRPVTSELLIMTVWLTGELCALDVLNASLRFGAVRSAVLLAVTVLAFCVSFVCYLKYYHLEGRAMYRDGVIPLAAAGISVFVFMIVHALS